MHKAITYTPELAVIICERLAAGESLKAICRDEGMPPDSTVRLWVIDDHNGFAAQYARARDVGLDIMADDLVEIADTTQEGVKTKETLFGDEVTRADMLEHRRLRVDARKWYLSKLAPKRYGDKQQVEVSGSIDIAQRIVNARKRAGSK
jgi:hypothetical protein